jgi:hypothetical protein
MAEPIRPKTVGVTPEAAEALKAQGMTIDPHDIVSDVPDHEITIDDIEDPFPALGEYIGLSASPDEVTSTGDTIDAELAGNEGDGAGAYGAPDSAPAPSRQRRAISALHTGPNWEKGEPREATTKPPTLDEWTSFFGKVVIKIACDWYLSFAFRGIDEDMVSDRDLERLALDDDERKLIAVPLAELSNKSKFMRKHGRSLVAGGDSFYALVVLGKWMSRVNRIASKYRPKQPKVRVHGMGNNGNSGQSSAQANGTAYSTGTGNGRVPNGYPIYPGSG